MKKHLFFLLISLSITAQITTGYYDSASSLTGYQLKTELQKIISKKVINYNYSKLGSYYHQTDADKYNKNDKNN